MMPPLTSAQQALLARAAHRIAEFCEKSPVTCELLGFDRHERETLRQIAQKIQQHNRAKALQKTEI